MQREGVQAVWAKLLVDGFAEAGVRDVVVSPGARSTPLVLAALAQPALRCHDIIDERSAAFFALGQARVTGRPSLCIATSGTAGAHYLAAAIEAGMSFTPLVLVTADRPVELTGCGAPQAIDQLKMFGDHVRWFFELGAADGSFDAMRALRRIAAQAVHAACYPLPGAVHLNARARRPLEPPSCAGASDAALEREIGRASSAPVVETALPTRAPSEETTARLADLCLRAERGLIVIGPSAPIAREDRQATLKLAARTGFPVFAEATSQLRFASGLDHAGVAVCDAMDVLLQVPRFRTLCAPDLILQLGSAPTSRAWAEHIERNRSVRRVVVAPFGWNDPDGSASLMIFADIPATVRALSLAIEARRTPAAPEEVGRAPRAFAPPPGDTGRVVPSSPSTRGAPSHWALELDAANAIAQRAIATSLALDGVDRPLSEGMVAHAVIANVPQGTWVVVGNGLAVRHLDTFVRAGTNDVRVLCQRGASGIDGLVSGAAGAASVSADPVVLLVGDVSVLHDLGGLFATRRISIPLAIVILHNDGGRIFEQLPIARSVAARPGLLDHWVTPHGLAFGHAAELFGLAHRRVQSRSALVSALEGAVRKPGPTLIEAVVPPHAHLAELERLVEDIARELSTGKEES